MSREASSMWVLATAVASGLLPPAPGSAQATPAFTLQDVAFLSGCWSGRAGSMQLREHWSEAEGGAMLGTTRFFREGAVVDWEFGRIVESANGVTLWPYPRGVMSEHGFGLVRAGTELVFENLEHDFPVRIVYRPVGADGLRVRIEGADGQGQEWGIGRVTCPGADAVFRLDSLAAGVYAAVVLREPDAYAFANSLVVIGDSGVLVVDTQQSPRAARALIREIEALTDLPVRWVVNTHWHGDHVNGNSAYRARWPAVEFHGTRGTVAGMRGPGARVRAEELGRLPDEIREREGWLEAGRLPDGRLVDADLRARVSRSLELRRAYYDELARLEVVHPERIVDDRATLDLGRRRVTLISVGSAHTDGDLVVLVEGERILAVGDLLEEAAPWIEGADLAGWAAALRLLQTLEPTAILPAHGGGVRGRSLLDGEAALFGDLVRLAREAAGRSEPAAYVRAGLEAHRAFFADLRVSPEAFDAWAAAAAELALDHVR
jgi:cyclase